MTPKFFVPLVMAYCCALQSLANTYSGQQMLEILGEKKHSDATDAFKTQYLLDKLYKNPENGIRLSFTREEVSTVSTIMLTNSGYEMNDVVYKSFRGVIPFGITWEDNEESLTRKLGVAKLSNDEKMKFKKDGIHINVYFKNSSHKKISHIKFSQPITALTPYRVDADHNAPVAVAETPVSNDRTKDKDVEEVKPKPTIKQPNTNAKIDALAMPATFGNKPSAATEVKSKSAFYNAIMNVFESGEEELFKDIKRGALGQQNFWNYKYTYATSINIPGEKYNMLYSFPFATSQLDFVSVLEEGDAQAPIQSKYTEIENKLKAEFKLTEGWTYHYILNQDNPTGLKDFEVKNSRLGSIVLDHSINPAGKHVLYLRFLLQYD